MKISVKNLNVTMDLGNDGITFDVYDNQGTFQGDLRLGKGTVEWCKGKTRGGNGTKVKWPELIAFFEAKQAALAAKKKTTTKSTKKTSTAKSNTKKAPAV